MTILLRVMVVYETYISFLRVFGKTNWDVVLTYMKIFESPNVYALAQSTMARC